MRRAVFCIILLFSFILLPSPAFADNKFTLSANLKYEVHSDANTAVTEEFTLTNNTPDYYVREYQINIGDSEIYNLHANDDLGLLSIDQVKNGKQLQAIVYFRQQVLGLGQTYHWAITYDTPSLARKIGRLWQIDIPKTNLAADNIPYNVNLVVPAVFGQAVLTSPATPNLTWNDQAKTKMFTAVFDPNADVFPYQAYTFHLQYQLYNSRLYPIIDSVPLPPDTEYQKIFLSFLNPRPQDVVLDENGNWLAQYYLGPAARLDVEASGSAAIFQASVIKPTVLISKITNTEKTDLWPKDDALIRIKSQQLGSPNAIFNYIVDRVNLSGQSKSRPGGKQVFLSSTATNSLDFSDVFVTMNRSLNIPTRELTGFFWQNNQSVLQSWVEYYDSNKNLWQTADPYLAKQTTGINLASWDFNHFTVAIYGQDSQFPSIPIGPNNVSLIPVALELNPGQLPNISYHAVVPPLVTAGFNINASAFLENLGPTISSGETIVLQADNINIAKTSLNSGPLPPFAERQIDLPLEPTSLLSDSNAIIRLEIDGHHDTFKIRIQPIYQSKFIIVLGGLTLAGLIAIIAQITRSILLQKRRR